MKLEVKVFTYDIEGNLLNRRFIVTDTETAIGQRINKKPEKGYDNNMVVWTYVTDDLNVADDFAAKKWIIDPHRLYFFTLDPRNNDVVLEFSKDMGNFLEKAAAQHKLKGYRCIHEYTNLDNNMFKFGGIGESIFDKIYYISDRNKINDARLALRTLIKNHLNELDIEKAFYNDLLNKIVLDDSVSSPVNINEFIDSIDNPIIEIEEITVEKKSLWSSFSRKLSSIFSHSPV